MSKPRVPTRSDDIVLGMKVRDIVTGFTGIATSCTRFLNGCDRITVCPPVEKDKPGALPDAFTFDWMQLEILDNGVAKIPEPKPMMRTGGPQREGRTQRTSDRR